MCSTYEFRANSFGSVVNCIIIIINLLYAAYLQLYSSDKTVFLGYVMLQLHVALFRMTNVLYLKISTFRNMGAVPSVAVSIMMITIMYIASYIIVALAQRE